MHLLYLRILTLHRAQNCFHANASLIVGRCRGESDMGCRGWGGGAPFFSCADTISFSRSSSHKFGPDPRRHLRQMMRGCKLCIPLIRLFLPPSLSCTPSFTAATYGRQLCREPQSVFTARRTLSHTAAQMLDQRGARFQPSCLWPHFFFVSLPLACSCTTAAACSSSPQQG